MATASGPREPVIFSYSEVVWSECFESVRDIVALDARSHGDLVSLVRDLACPEHDATQLNPRGEILARDAAKSLTHLSPQVRRGPKRWSHMERAGLFEECPAVVPRAPACPVPRPPPAALAARRA